MAEVGNDLNRPPNPNQGPRFLYHFGNGVLTQETALKKEFLLRIVYTPFRASTLSGELHSASMPKEHIHKRQLS